MRDGKRAVDADLEHRAGDVVLLARQRLLFPFPLLDEGARDREPEMFGEVGRSADGENRAPFVEETAHLRHRLGYRHATHSRAPFPGDGCGVERAAATATAALLPAIPLRDRAIDEDDDVVLRAEGASVELRREHDLVREFIALEQPSHPPGGHRAAVRVPQGDPRLSEPTSI